MDAKTIIAIVLVVFIDYRNRACRVHCGCGGMAEYP